VSTAALLFGTVPYEWAEEQGALHRRIHGRQ
jgi:hypothetical protein